MNARDRSQPALDDPRVIEALDEYMAALQRGQKPDRKTFLGHHADIADALAQCLDGLEFVHSAAPQLSQPSQGEPPARGAEIQPEARCWSWVQSTVQAAPADGAR